MAYPTANVHRRNRRNLTRGSGPTPPAVICTITGSASTVTFTFSAPVNVSGTIPISVATLTAVSQTIVSPTVVTQLQSGTVATHAWTMAQPLPGVTSYEGAPVISVPSGTF
jgi:hypothetical protein